LVSGVKVDKRKNKGYDFFKKRYEGELGSEKDTTIVPWQ